jgi:hypothetical protein
MFKSYSSSLSYSSDGKNQVQQFNSNYKDNQKEFNQGYKRDSNLESEDKEEMFYKRRKQQDEFKKLYGKSKNNQDWTIKRYQNQDEFEPEIQPYQQHSEMFSKINSNFSPLPNINQKRVKPKFTPLPMLNSFGDYHEDNNITALPDRQINQIQEIETPMPMTRNSIINSTDFRQVSRNFIQFEDQFNDSFFK